MALKTWAAHFAVVSSLLLLLLQRRARRKNQFRSRLARHQRRLRDRRISRAALQAPTMSAFATLFGSGCDQALTVSPLQDLIIGFFRYVLFRYEEVYNELSPYGL
ncbi:hypothetical protein PR002_g24943 [Phytophthora rubi]|uniref:Uncharacterized protein n=1 Tax=Phytophthora rubi TaxID=129364 RepID=A0A6A3I646_9STRA|nr:hypothetical protein PR002_g24943 [Phytophthora rubi]